jgi:hypothetical protein
MTLRADVHLDSPRLVLGRTLRAVPGVEVEVEPQATADVLFVSVRAPDGDGGASFDAFETALGADPGVGGFGPSGAGDGRRIYAVETDVDRPLLSEVAAEMGINVVRTYSPAGDTGWTFELEAQDRETIVEFRSDWNRLGIPFEVRRLFYAEGDRPDGVGLSDVQRETLLAAFRNGYFEIPRDVSQRELADLLDASPTAVSQRLRRGVAALVASTIAAEE